MAQGASDEEDGVIVYLDSGRGMTAALMLGALLDAGADAALIQRILGTITLPRIALMRTKEHGGAVSGTVASVAIGPVQRGTAAIEVIRALENGKVPLAVRTWGGGMIARLLEAEALAHGEPLDAVPLTDPVTIAELLTVSAALAALQVVRVKELQANYKQTRPEAGVYRIVNRKNNRALLGSTPDLTSIRNKLAFFKTTNSPGVLDYRLRDDVRAFGIDAFSLEVLEVFDTEAEMTREETLRDLATLEDLWRENLDPALLY